VHALPSSRILATAAAGLGLVLSLPASAAAAPSQLTVLATSGQAAPGGSSFTAFGDPVLNEQGLVAFQGLLASGPDHEPSVGLYMASPGQLAAIASEQAQAPGGVGVLAHPPGDLNGSGAFPFIPRLDTAGDAYWVGDYHAGGPGYYADSMGVFLNAGRFAVQGDPTPDGQTFDFDFDYAVPPQVSPGGRLALLTELCPCGANGLSPGSGIYAWTGGTWQKVVRRGDPTPGGDGTFEPQDAEDPMGFGPPGVNDAGQVAFAARKRVAGRTVDGLYLDSGGNLQELVGAGETLPDGRTAATLYDVQHGPALNAAGEVAVLIGTSDAGSGIYLFGGGQGPQLVVHTGDPDPAGGGMVVCGLGHPGLGSDGTLAFTATLGLPGTPCLEGTVDAMYVGQPGHLARAAQIAVPSEISMQGGPSVGPDMPYVSGKGWVAILVQDNGGGRTLDVWDGQSLRRVAGTGDLIAGRTVTSLDLAGEDTPGAVALNDAGELVFRAFSAGGSQIVLASLAGAPATPALPAWLSTAQGQQAQPAGAPVVTGVSPASGPDTGGQTVTIAGSNLAGATSVLFGDYGQGQDVQVAPDGRSLQVVTPAASWGDGQVYVQVTTPAGASAVTSATQYTFEPGSAAQGAEVTVAGRQVAFEAASHSGAVGSVNGYTADTFDLESGQAGNDFYGGADLQLGADGSGNPTLSGNLAVVAAGGALGAAPGSATVPAVAGETLLVLDHAGRYALVTVQSASPQTVAFTYQMAAPSQAGPRQVTIRLTIGSDTATVDGQAVGLDVPATIGSSGRTLVPFRFLGQALGAQVGWNDATHTATYVLGSVQVNVPVGSLQATVNGAGVSLDAPAVIVGGRTLVPVRFIGQALGATVAWDPSSQTVTITYSAP
jgi:hypothetical protein